MNTILWDYQLVWPDVWPKNKCRSLWPIFHGPVILPYILKTIWYMTTILWDYESVWPDVWPNDKCRLLWLYFMVQWFCLIFWRLFDIRTPYFRIMCQYDPMFDLKINVSHCDLYFLVQWFCLISWRLFDAWTPYFGIMSQYDMMFDLKINVGHCDQYFMVQWFCLMSWRLFDMNTILWDYESIWPHVWPKNKCRSLWPIFHCPLILPYSFIFDGWMSYFWKMSQFNTVQWFVFF